MGELLQNPNKDADAWKYACQLIWHKITLKQTQNFNLNLNWLTRTCRKNCFWGSTKLPELPVGFAPGCENQNSGDVFESDTGHGENGQSTNVSHVGRLYVFW